MPVSIDNALRILRRKGWAISSDSRGAWIIERAALSSEDLALIADRLNRRADNAARDLRD